MLPRMTKRRVRNLGGGLVLAAALLLAAPRALAADDAKEASQTIAQYKKTDPGLSKFFAKAAGYAVFPGVGKGGIGLGGAYGTGIVYQGGKTVGHTSLTQVTIGFQLGGQTYSEIIFFETKKALADFKAGDFAFSAQASAVALSTGASSTAKYEGGVAVFTATKRGLMVEASVGGQKFSYEASGAAK